MTNVITISGYDEDKFRVRFAGRRLVGVERLNGSRRWTKVAKRNNESGTRGQADWYVEDRKVTVYDGSCVEYRVWLDGKTVRVRQRSMSNPYFAARDRRWRKVEEQAHHTGHSGRCHWASRTAA